MAATTTPHILLFGDQLVEKLPAIRNLYNISRTRPQLRHFLRAATDVAQLQLSALTPSERPGFGHFSDLLDLAEFYQASQHPYETAGAVLITTAQIGELLCIAEDDSSILGAGKVYPLGFCVGLLAASVAAGSIDTSDLVRLGAEAVGISFRLGLELDRRARNIEDSPKTWGTTLIGPLKDIEKRVAKFNQNQPQLRHAYLGVATDTWTTVFGPPSTIEALSASDILSDIPKSPLTAATSVHAPHLPPLDIEKIVGNAAVFENARVFRTVLSSSTCEPFPAKHLKDLLHRSVIDITAAPLWLEKTVRAVGASLKGSDAVLSTVGPTPHTPMVQKILQQQQVNVHLGSGAQAADRANTRGGSGLVAIVGMSGRFPGCDSISEFWDLLAAGTPTHEEVPETRFALDEFFDPNEDKKNCVLNRFGCFLKNPGDFDNKFFNVSPREAMQMDPLQRMFLMTTFEALEQAGYAHNGSNSTHNSRISTFFGQTTEDWRTINDQQGTDTHYLPSSNRAFAPGRIAHHFKWGGGYYNVDTACSSSSTSVYLACNSLIDRECDTSIVGGGSLCVIPELFSGLGKGGFLSKNTVDGSCKSFQESADGYCRGEAVGIVVLKRLEDAVAENDNILAVIRGTARNSNAGAGSITHPGEAAQEALFTEILRKANVDPNEIGFVEMHGTGTQAGDKAEFNTVSRVFGRNRGKDNPLHIGAVKANVGHSEAAAGVVSLIKTVLMLQKDGRIPPQPGYPFTLNPNFKEMDKFNMKIADGTTRLKAWSKGDGKRKMLINGFDAAGGNTSMLIEDAPSPKKLAPHPRRSHLVVVSGRTATALEANKERLRNWLNDNPGCEMSSLAYTTTARRMHELQRDSFVVSSVEELYGKLNPTETSIAQPAKPGSLIFIFTGQGSPYTGMGANLYKTSPRFQRTLNSFQAVADSQGQANFLDLITGTKDIAKASAVETQMAIVALEIALAKYWQSLGLIPRLVMGHSLGEYAALCIAGVISVTDALYLVYQRASLIEKHCTPDAYAMLAIPQATEMVEKLLNKETRPTCEVSCINGPSATVVSGKQEELESLQTDLKAQKVSGTVLHIRYGFHSSQMDPVLNEFEKVAGNVVFAKPSIPVASTLLGELITEHGTFNGAYLKRQMREPVNFVGAVRICENEGLIKTGSNVVEVGPHPVCLSLVAQSLENAEPTSFASLRRGQDDWKSINTVLAGAYTAKLPVDWQELHKDYSNSLRLLDLPSYAFDLKNYWASYQEQGHQVIVQQEAAPAVAAKQLTPLATTGLQFLESFDDEAQAATFLSMTAEPNLFRAIQGHLVDGTAICPASVFGDMAATAAAWLFKETGSVVSAEKLRIVDCNMTHALVVHPVPDPDQVVRVSAQIEEGQQVNVSFSSTNNGKSADHGSCIIKVTSADAVRKQEWTKLQKLVKAQVQTLTEAGKNGLAHRMNTALVYKLFANLVDYGKPYQAIEEVYIAPNFEDAAARLKLGKTAGLGQFTCSPFAVDALVHLAGFMLNANLSKPNDDIHIANHIGSLHVLEDLTTDEHTCTCYASIQEQTAKGATFCDVYVFDSENLIAICSDIKFQKLTREVFGMMIGKEATPVPVKLIASNTPARVVEEDDDDNDEDSDNSDLDSDDDESGVATPASSLTDVEMFDLSGALLNAISARTGVSVSEMEPSSVFADMGIDSPMAIAILADFKKATGVELPASFFSTYETVAEGREELDGQPAPAAPAPKPTKTAKPAKQEKKVKKSKKTAAPAPAASSVKSTNLSGALLNAISARTGVSTSEMEPNSVFADMGIDSPMAIAILADFKKVTGVELPASFFSTYETVAEGKAELDGQEPGETAPAPEPAKAAPAKEKKAKKEPKVTAPAPVAAPTKSGNLSSALLNTISGRTGVSVSEMEPTSAFADMGIDSPMAIAILADFKKATGIELPASFFSTFETVAEGKEELDGDASETPGPTSAPKAELKAAPAPTKATPTAEPKKATQAPQSKKAPASVLAPKPQEIAAKVGGKQKTEPISRCVLIQGKSRNTEAPLFLITDGSGAVSAYIHLPALPNGRKIYALESPFLERPMDYTLTIQEMAECFTKSIRKVQPHGPYLIGGWSAGSIYAYETCYSLVQQGESINGLVLIDMRVPHSVPDAQEVTMAFVEKTGAFTGVNRSSNFLHGLSDKQKMHLTSTVRALIKYDPIPFPQGKEPGETHLIWATKGLNDSPNPEEHDPRITGPAAMMPAGEGKPLSEMSMEEFEIELKSWFFAKRMHFGKNGWEKFVGDNIDVTKVDGDHFSMVAPPIVKDLGVIILNAVARCAELEKRQREGIA